MTSELETPPITKADAITEMAFTLRKFPVLADKGFGCGTHYYRCASKDDMIFLVRAIGGKWKKQAAGSDFHMVKDFGAGVTLEIFIERTAVCERKVVGTKTITIPAVEAKPAIPAHEKEIDIIEWDCGTLLNDATK